MRPPAYMPQPVPTTLSTKAVMKPTRAPSHQPMAPPTVPPIRTKSLDMSLARPPPPERARREERVDQPVYRRLGRREPGAVVPDRHLPERHRVRYEGGDPGEPEDLQVRRAGGQRAPRDVRREAPHDNGIEEPHDQVLPHRHGAARKHGEHHDRALLELFDRSEEHTSELQSPCNLVCRLLL